MRNEEISYKTKCALADSLKKLMKQKEFSKITVSEIIRDCNVNRKTFYYHFEDINALLKWIFNQEAVQVLKQYTFEKDYEKVISYLFDYVENNSYMIHCAYDSLGREIMRSFFYQDAMAFSHNVIVQAEAELSVRITDSFRSFLCNLYTEGFAGMIILLFQNPGTFDKKQVTEYVSTILNHSIPAVLLAEGIPVSE